MNWRKYITYPLICLKNKNNELVYLRQLEHDQYKSSVEIAEKQFVRYSSLLESAYANTAFYKCHFDAGSFDPVSFRSLEDVRRVPFLTKRLLQERYDEMFSQLYDRESLLHDKTGGSTGVPTRFAYTQDRFDMRRAAEMRHNRWAKFDIGERCAIIWGARRDFGGKTSLRARLRSFITANNIVLDSSSLTDGACFDFIKKINTFKPKVILAYAKSLVYIADFIKQNSCEVFSPHAIISSSELLADKERLYVEEVFHAPVYDRYGARETSVIASECEEHTMHVHDEGVYVECIREDGSLCDIGEEGEIVVTDLLNDAFPLIRYRIGDMGMKLPNDCACGRGLSVMKMTSGRVSDFILTPKDRRVSGAAITAYVCTKIDGLGEVQFYQKERDRVLIRIVPNNKFSDATLAAFDRRVRDFLDNIVPDIEIVERLEVPASGKHQFVINELLKDEK